MQNTDATIETQQIEEVFGLTGGELADAPWTARDSVGAAQTFAYWYEGPPEWCARDYADRFEAEYRTLVCCCLFGGAPETLEDDGGTWSRVACFTSSGEAECPWRHGDEGADNGHRPCVLCDASEGDEHGYVYLGDGWCEVVYRRRNVEAIAGVDATDRVA